ncbi:sensor histidine kinase [Nocardioides allogilvus]|uniref:sensor histidine kinase n=1 Tax=Nocardioides allogilvus TaxID=2072017 RepID=UPI000D2FD8DE|nr:sensor histidine kinase [Nocardioides allogilvus]
MSDARPEVDATNPWERWGWAFASIWLVFLVYPIVATLEAHVATGWKVATFACILGFAVSNILGYSLWAGRAWLALTLMGVLALATTPVIGVEALAFTPYLGMLSALQLPDPWWKWATFVAVVLPVLSLAGPDWFPAWFFLMVWPIMLGGVLIRVFGDRAQEATETRNRLALVAERERVARDVHDVLGHSLTALSIKAELASRLIEVDPARAKAELESIQETARQALAEVRATVGGLRAANLEAELATAPRVLADAGIRTQVLGSVADTDPRHRALLAWVLRESVTNVVRHARATSVSVELGPTGLVVADDGAGFEATGGREGNGLRGMRERVSAAGGTLQVSSGPGTRVEVVLP